MWDVSGDGVNGFTERRNNLPPEEVEVISKNIPDTVGIFTIKGISGNSVSDLEYNLIRRYYMISDNLKREDNKINTIIFVLPQFYFRNYDTKKTSHLHGYRDLEKSKAIYHYEDQQIESLSLLHEFMSINNNTEKHPEYTSLGRVYKANDAFREAIVRNIGEEYKDLTENFYVVTSSYHENNQLATMKAMHILLRGIYKAIGFEGSVGLKRWVETWRRGGAKEYLATLVETQKRKKKSLTDRIDNLKSQMTEYFRDLTPVDFFLRNEEATLAKINEQLVLCESIPDVKSAYIDHEGSFHVFTKHIYIKQPITQVTIPGDYNEDEDESEDDVVLDAGGLKNLHWDIGKLHITVNKNGNTYIVCSTRQVQGWCGYLVGHPHVTDNDGSVCLGDISTIVYELLNMHEYSSLAGLLVNFAKSVNLADDAGQSITKWPVIQLKTS